MFRSDDEGCVDSPLLQLFCRIQPGQRQQMIAHRHFIGIQQVLLQLSTPADGSATKAAQAQLLDETVAGKQISLARDANGRLRWRRVFVFEYSDTGNNRRSGSISLLGHDVEFLHVRPNLYVIPSPHENGLPRRTSNCVAHAAGGKIGNTAHRINRLESCAWKADSFCMSICLRSAGSSSSPRSTQAMSEKMRALPKAGHAKLFVNYCLNCHGASYLRYKNLLDLGLTEEQVKENQLEARRWLADQRRGHIARVQIEPDGEQDDQSGEGAEYPVVFFVRSSGGMAPHAIEIGDFNDPAADEEAFVPGVF